MRYGRQNFGEILGLRIDIAGDVQRALSRLVVKENTAKERD